MRQYPTLRQLSIGFSSLFMIVLFVIILVLSSRALLNTIDRFEETSTTDLLAQSAVRFQDTLETLAAVTQDTALRDITLRYTALDNTNRNTTPEGSRSDNSLWPDLYDPQRLVPFGIDFVLITDPAGNVLDAREFDQEHRIYTSMQPGMIERLEPVAQETLTQNNRQPRSISGYFDIAGTTYAAALCPVLDQTESQPPQHPQAILMLGLKTESILAKTRQTAYIQTISSTDTDPDQLLMPLPSLLPAQNLSLASQSPRAHPSEALRSLGLPFLVLAIMCFTVIGLMAHVVEKFMYKPLESLATQVAAVGTNTTYAPIANQYHNRELNFLAGSIQDMLNRIAVSQQTIQTTNAWLQIYSKAVHTTADDFLIMSPEGVIQFMNPAAVRNMSAMDTQLLGKDIWPYIEDHDLADQIKEIVLNRQTWRGEIVFRPKDDPDPQLIIEEATFSPVLTDDNGFEHITLIKHSIQVKKHYENLIQHLAHYNTLTQLPNRLWLRNQL
ncbi:MAG: hypothetical protein FWG40_06845, partial [Peptococcaceae bacterium]|nr:hypothetical protein [Peptococcaceae bacterium]